MKINTVLLVGNFTKGSLELSYYNAFIEKGYNVECFNIVQAEEKYCRFKPFGSIINKYYTFKNNISLIELLDELKKLSPKIDFEDNPDLLGVPFNLAVPNMINNNGDGISGATASKIAKRFMNKYLNIEHNKDRVIGHITNYSFNRIGDNKFLTEEEVGKTLDPVYLSVAGVIYKTVDKKFTSLMLRNSDPKDSFYNSISASWEIGFSNYYLAVGSQSLKEADIITDPKQIQEFSQY